jgi:hypothetical protein
MKCESNRTSLYGDSAPATPGFNAFGPEWISRRAAFAAPAIPAAKSALGAHPCVALSSAQVLPEWITSTLPVKAFAANGANPLNFVSHSRGSLQGSQPTVQSHPVFGLFQKPHRSAAFAGVACKRCYRVPAGNTLVDERPQPAASGLHVSGRKGFRVQDN